MLIFKFLASLCVVWFYIPSFVFSRTALAIQPVFQDCEPISCSPNSQIISFPFFIPRRQPHFCGSTGFEITCDRKGQPVLQNKLIVKQIFYQNHSLRVVNEDYLDVSNMVSTPGRSLIRSSIFSISNPLSQDTLLLFSCSQASTLNPISSALLPYVLGANSYGMLLVISRRDPNILEAASKCRSTATIAIELPHSEMSHDPLMYKEYYDAVDRGIWMKWEATKDCGQCEESGGRCGTDLDSQMSCYCQDGQRYDLKCPQRSSRTSSVIITVSAVATTGVIFAIILWLQWLKLKSGKRSLRFWKKRTDQNQNIINFFKRSGSFLAPKRYSYHDVKRMTSCFKYKLGQGGFGGVYKGEMKNGCLVAVKVLNTSKTGSGEDFINEVASISKTSHVNIVSLIGFCFEGSKRALIYEFMPNGSLENFIYEEKSSGPKRLLGWHILHEISLGIAQGLEYLHQGCNTRILHFDINPHNILLDGEFCPKISDFGLAKVCERRKESAVMSSMLGARGTVGYIAPEQVCRSFGPVSYKSDVYSYGMMILEMVGGRKNVDVGVDNPSEIYFPHWIYNRLKRGQELELNGIMRNEDSVYARKMVMVGLWCIQSDPANRPPMSRVVDMLQGSVESLPPPAKPFLYSPVRSPEHSSASDTFGVYLDA